MPHFVIKRVVTEYVPITKSTEELNTIGMLVDEQLKQMVARFNQMPVREAEQHGIPEELTVHFDESAWFDLVQMYGPRDNPTVGVPYDPPRKPTLKRSFKQDD